MKLRIEKNIYGGDGLARVAEGEYAGRAVAVPFTLAGETVEAALTASRRPLADATLLEILAPSPHRVQAGCIHFGTCGGCQYQHSDYAQQLKIKRDILAETLSRAGVTAFPQIETHSAEPWGYRNRIRLHVRAGADGVALGYKRRNSNEFLPISECPIAAPLLWRAAQAALSVEASCELTARVLTLASELELFCNNDESELLMSVYATAPIDNDVFQRWCQQIASLVPQLRGAGTEIPAPASARRKQTVAPASGLSWGEASIRYTAAGRRYSVSRGAFFQVNRFLVDTLIAIVTDGRSGGEAWDLYAGAGLFSKPLAEKFARVIAVESALPAADDLRAHLAAAGAAHRALPLQVLEFLTSHAARKKIVAPDLIVADPPRAGLGAEVSAALSLIAAPELIYVSCDPETLARDLAALIKSGYRLTQLHLVDLFPQTFHLETIAVLHHGTA